MTARRPKHFFREDAAGGTRPLSVSVNLAPPPGLARLPHDQYVAAIADLINIAALERGGIGKAVLGPGTILAQDWNDSPSTPETRRQICPTVACRDKWRRIERLQMNKVFQKTYRHAFEAFRTGLTALFPLGT